MFCTFVLIKDVPDLPLNSPCVETNGQLIHLNWEMARQKNEKSIWYTVEMNRMEESSQWIVVKKYIQLSCVSLGDSFPTENCRFRVFAENEAGKSSPTLPITLERNESKIYVYMFSI